MLSPNPIAEIVAELRDVLGAEYTALIAGASTTAEVRAWAISEK